jgi:hypothetical protein
MIQWKNPRSFSGERPRTAGDKESRVLRKFWPALLTAGVLIAAISPSWAEDDAPSVKALDVRRIVACRSVADHEPVGISETFRADEPVVCWMYVTVPRAPVAASQVWYAGGEPVATVPMTIRGESFRTFSRRNVWPGEWSVEAVDADGVVMGSVHFTVTR